MIDLTAKLLIAMPGMSDPRFEHSVVFLCEHSESGAMGLIINKPAEDLAFAELLKQLKIELSGGGPDLPIHFGGPVEPGRGFVLHSTDYDGNSSTLTINSRFAMTATLDVLEDIEKGTGPSQSLLALGYAGWAPGQLEEELQNNGWLTCEGSHEIVFRADDEQKWTRALGALGVDALTLSSAAGRA